MAKQPTSKATTVVVGESTTPQLYITTTAVCLRGTIIPSGQAVELTLDEAASLVGTAVTQVVSTTGDTK